MQTFPSHELSYCFLTSFYSRKEKMTAGKSFVLAHDKFLWWAILRTTLPLTRAHVLSRCCSWNRPHFCSFRRCCCSVTSSQTASTLVPRTPRQRQLVPLMLFPVSMFHGRALTCLSMTGVCFPQPTVLRQFMGCKLFLECSVFFGPRVKLKCLWTANLLVIDLVQYSSFLNVSGLENTQPSWKLAIFILPHLFYLQF